MVQHTIFLLTIFLFTGYGEAAECDNGWVAYKDEFCVQLFPSLLTYDEAKAFCASQGTEMSKSTLVFVKELAMQELLVTYTDDVFDNVWLGGRYNEAAGEFLWDEGDPLTYTNWQEGSPRNDSDSNICIDFRPQNAKDLLDTPGKWTDVNCQRRNRVMCQRILPWTLQDAIGEIIKLRKDLQAVNARVVPVGSIYIEYDAQPSPAELWPELTWEDISSTYAGLFFRTAGGNAASWGTTQQECAPRITDMSYSRIFDEDNLPYNLTIPASGWSGYGLAGWYYYDGSNDIDYEGIRFNTRGCEVRPRNKAVRIWKRTA